jgi:hypothetical protein
VVIINAFAGEQERCNRIGGEQSCSTRELKVRCSGFL